MPAESWKTPKRERMGMKEGGDGEEGQFRVCVEDSVRVSAGITWS